MTHKRNSLPIQYVKHDGIKFPKQPYVYQVKKSIRLNNVSKLNQFKVFKNTLKCITDPDMYFISTTPVVARSNL